jgi:anti-anti-sigma factor
MLSVQLELSDTRGQRSAATIAAPLARNLRTFRANSLRRVQSSVLVEAGHRSLATTGQDVSRGMTRLSGISEARWPRGSASIGGRPNRFFTVRTEYAPGGASLLRVQGMLDESTASMLEQRLITEARNCRVRPARLLLDLSGTTFLDRAGLDALLHSQTLLAGESCTVELVEQSPAVVRLLHEAHLDGESWMSQATGRDGMSPPASAAD